MDRAVHRIEFDVPRPSRRPFAWIAFGLFTLSAGAFGWHVGGDTTLGIAITGLSAVIVLRAAATRAALRAVPWAVVAAEIDPEGGTFTVVERDQVSRAQRRTSIPLSHYLTANVREDTRRCVLHTEFFEFAFSGTDESADQIVETLRSAASNAPDRLVERPESGRFDVHRGADEVTISWRGRTLWEEYLRLASTLAFLFAATPLLDVAYGFFFVLFSALLGYFFVRKVRRIWRWSGLTRHLEIDARTIRLEPGVKPEQPRISIRDVHLLPSFGGSVAIPIVEVQIGESFVDGMDRRVGVTARDAMRSLEFDDDPSWWALLKALLAFLVGAARDLQSTYRDHWVATVDGAGFQEGLELTLLIREELARDGDWTPHPRARYRRRGESE